MLLIEDCPVVEPSPGHPAKLRQRAENPLDHVCLQHDLAVFVSAFTEITLLQRTHHPCAGMLHDGYRHGAM